jgi:pilus assembly protein CpaB
MRRRILMLLAAAVLAGFSAIAVVAYGHGADRRALDGAQGTWVLLATGTIPADTTGKEIRTRKLVRQVMMPARTVPEGALTKLDAAFDDQRLNEQLNPDQMLMNGQFAPAPPATPAPSPTFVLPKGQVAVAVQLNIARQVAGNVDIGSKVVVYQTYGGTTSVLLPTATVISVGERPKPLVIASVESASPGATVQPTVVASSSTGGEGEKLEYYVVTLGVNPSDAEKLVGAYNTAILHLGLLSTPTPTPSATTGGGAS